VEAKEDEIDKLYKQVLEANAQLQEYERKEQRLKNRTFVDQHAEVL
jgi:hypothetical protein